MTFPASVECGDFVRGQQVDHVAADGGDVRRRGLAEGGLAPLGQADERASCVVGAAPGAAATTTSASRA